MALMRRISWGVWVCVLCATAYGQRPVPLADDVGEPLLPYGISEQEVALSGQLAYFFEDEDGTDVVHVIGDAHLTLGEPQGQQLRGREAVVWIAQREFEDRTYHHLEVLLWQDAEVSEVGHTITSGPALFVTLNSYSGITTNVDDVALRSSADTQVYQRGRDVRSAYAAGTLHVPDENVSLRVYQATGLGAERKQVKQRPPILMQFPGEFTTLEVDGRSVITVAGGAYLSRGDSGSGDFLEIRADAVVVFLPRSISGGEVDEAQDAGLGAGERGSDEWARSTRRRTDRKEADRQLLSTGLGDDVEVEAVYVEGDVIMSQGANMIRASRIYYDFVREKALILDAVVRATLLERNVPIYVRAEEVRQLSANRFVASQAWLTTSEFYTPHYHVGAARVELTDRTPPTTAGRRTGIRAGSFRIRHATLNVSGHPIGYWPYIHGRVDTSETAVRSVRSGYSDDFGVEIETEWDFLNVLGLETPDGFSSTLSLDFFSERGPAIGIDADYEQDRYYGYVRSYLLNDNGSDFLGRDRENLSRKDVRGRFLWRHRQYLQDDWQISLELSDISDRGFLEEFFESEFDTGKEQETLLYLKKQRDNWAFTTQLQTRLMDFTTTTERVPEFGYVRVGEPLGNGATWHSDNRLGVVRYRPADQMFRELLRDGRHVGSGSVARLDSRQEIGCPVDLGPVRLVPFVSARGTAWDDSPSEGGLARALGAVGVRSSMYLSRDYPEARSSLFDIDGVRHIVKPELVAWASAANRDADDLFLFDDRIEGVDATDGVTLGVRQRWQTKRGQGATRRVVDFLTLDLEVGVFNDSDGEALTNGYTSFSRPEESVARNFVNGAMVWRVNDRTALLSEVNFDMNDGAVDVFNLSLAVERSPRFSYLLGYRYIGDTDSNLLGFDMNYRLTEKHTLALREAFDLERGQTLDFTIAFIRKFPRWFSAVSFELDEAEDDYGVSFSLWPEGLPRATLGSRRFTGLANTTRIEND